MEVFINRKYLFVWKHVKKLEKNNNNSLADEGLATVLHENIVLR